MTDLHIISGGTGMDTHIVMADGTKLLPTSAEITLEANAANTVRLTFMLPSIDVRAHLNEVILVCPACGSNQLHPCDGPSPVPADRPTVAQAARGITVFDSDGTPHNFPHRFLPPAPPVPDDEVYGD